jgi:response regulator RpfG family c-di-GMP phosphodiesterase
MNVTFPSRYFSGFSFSELGFHIDQQNLRVRAEQLRTRMAMFPTLVLSQVVLQLLFVWLFWAQVPHEKLLMWLAAVYALHTAEMVMWVLHRHELNTIRECRDWHIHFTIFALAVGILWGVAAFSFFPDSISFQSMLICVMLGLVAGAITMNLAHPPALYGYTFGIMLPLIARVAMENDEFHWILVLMLILFVALVVVAGRGLSGTFMLSLQQRFENLSLLQQLTVQEAETEDARRELELANNELRDHETKLEQMVQERTAELMHRTHEIELIKDTTIMAMSSLAEIRDNETGNHIRRTQNYIRALAVDMKDHPRFSHFLTNENIILLYKIAPLHDVGKVGIPDRILHKPGKLTEDEFEVMKTHATLGGNAIAAAVIGLDFFSPFLEAARQIAMSHHEKWDGSGYPEGLRGEGIPIPARLMALADVYDALSCRRVYKPAMAHDDVAAIIYDGRGKHFDPDVVDSFMSIQPQFVEIAERFSD